jgi:hypothetical protein
LQEQVATAFGPRTADPAALEYERLQLQQLSAGLEVLLDPQQRLAYDITFPPRSSESKEVEKKIPEGPPKAQNDQAQALASAAIAFAKLLGRGKL